MKNFSSYKNQIVKDEFYFKISDQIANFDQLQIGDKILVTVSGGVDSVALILIMDTLQKFELNIAHVNHNLRNESSQDELFVKKIASDLQIPFFVAHLNPSEIGRNMGVEKWARNERYKFFDQTLKKISGDWVMTAHHANDQIETTLMNISRKTGMLGLRGIAKSRNKILRPLIENAKIEILDFAKRIDFTYQYDKSNDDVSMLRNFIRHKIINPWENKQPFLIKNFSSSSTYFKDWTVGFDYLIKTFIMGEINQSKNKFEIPIHIIEEMPLIIKIRLIQLLVNSNEDLWSQHHFNMLRKFLKKSKTGDMHLLHNGWTLLYDRISIKGFMSIENFSTKKFHIRLNEPLHFQNYKYDIRLCNKRTMYNSKKNKEFVDWHKIKNCKLEVRNWSFGDIFQPLGMSGNQKISDFLTNKKIDRISKKRQTVLTANNIIFWLCGERIADWVKITNETRKMAVITRTFIDQ